jgi:hypothetical protein
MLLPPSRPFPLDDSLGMAVARPILDRSLRPGRNNIFVQYNTVRKTRSMMTNVSQALAGAMGDVIGSHEKTSVWISNVPTHSFWFTRFMMGFHRHVGDLKKQDKAITIDVLLEADKLLEGEWKRLGNWKEKLPEAKRIAEMGLLVCCWVLSQLSRRRNAPDRGSRNSKEFTEPLGASCVFLCIYQSKNKRPASVRVKV